MLTGICVKHTESPYPEGPQALAASAFIVATWGLDLTPAPSFGAACLSGRPPPEISGSMKLGDLNSFVRIFWSLGEGCCFCLFFSISDPKVVMEEFV